MHKNTRNIIEAIAISLLLSLIYWEVTFYLTFLEDLRPWVLYIYTSASVAFLLFNYQKKDITLFLCSLPYLLPVALLSDSKLLGFVAMLPILVNAKLIIHHIKNTYFSIVTKSILAIILGNTVIHTIACLWHKVEPASGDLWDVYIEAIYWAVTTLTTMGYGDIVPHSLWGRVYAIFAMIIGVMFYALIVGQVAASISSYNRRKVEKQDKLEHLSSFFKYYDVPSNLRSEIFNYYENYLEKKANEKELAVLRELPNSVEKELLNYVNMKNLKKLRLFYGAHSECLRLIVNSLQEREVGPGEKIIRSGVVGTELYLIYHGHVEVRKNGEVIAELGPGDSFGEMALVEGRVREADIIAKTYCDLYILTKEDFLDALKKYPYLQKNVDDLIHSRKNFLNKR
tara:strand:- start:17045 stop:18238 length:1194 start_codon:yes stop_codon:yes gene_type:complete